MKISSFEVVYKGKIYTRYKSDWGVSYICLSNQCIIRCRNPIIINYIENMYLVSLREEKLKRILE